MGIVEQMSENPYANLHCFAKLIFFPNGFGASMVSGPYSYGGDKGLYEIAVLEGNKENWNITYKTPISSDVIGYLTLDEAEEILKKIKELDDPR